MEPLSYAATALGLVSSVIGGVAWYRSTIRKQYASERDFNHIRNSIAQLSQAVADQNKFTEEQMSRFSDRLQAANYTLIEVKSLLIAKLGDSTIGRGG